LGQLQRYAALYALLSNSSGSLLPPALQGVICSLTTLYQIIKVPQAVFLVLRPPHMSVMSVWSCLQA
jgi:hypothetical protein